MDTLSVFRSSESVFVFLDQLTKLIESFSFLTPQVSVINLAFRGLAEQIPDYVVFLKLEGEKLRRYFLKFPQDFHEVPHRLNIKAFWKQPVIIIMG